jgi:O-antigen/teichoic acid export membrane protein
VQPPGKVLKFSLPLWVVAAATQLALGTDVPISGYFFGVEAAGHYALGAMLPAAAMGLLFAVTDASFPRLVASNLPRR